MFEGLFQPMHLMLVLTIVLIVFGPGKLPEVGKGFGEAIRNFKKGLNEITGSEERALPDDTAAASRTPAETARQDRPTA